MEDGLVRSLSIGLSQSGVRDHNERLLLSLIQRHGGMPGSDLSRLAGLSPPTVSSILRRLESEGLVRRGDPVRGKVGQPSVPMRLNGDGAYFIGLKVGRRSMELVLTDFLGEIRAHANQTYAYPTPHETLKFAKEHMAGLVGCLPNASRDRLAGMGIAMPFFLWNWAQTLRVPQEEMDGWRTANLRASLSDSFDLPIFLQNDMTSACGAELVFGPSGGPRDFLYFYVGYFIGGGVVLNGGIYSGRGNSGALGPLPVPDGEGGVRPLIDVASLYLLERVIEDAGGAADAIWQAADTWDISGDLIDTWIETAARGVAHAIVAACSVIDFEAVKIDGWLPPEIRDRLVATVEAHLSEVTMTGIARPSITPGAIGPGARVMGAASLPLSNKYLVET